MSRGRKPESLENLKIRRTIRPARHNHRTTPLVEDRRCPAPPKWLRNGALLEWTRVAGALFEQGLLSRLDVAALAGYCDSYACWQEAKQQLEEHGATITNPSGREVASPWVAIRDQARKTCIEMASKFGMTPSDRPAAQRVATPPTPVDPAKSRFFEKIDLKGRGMAASDVKSKSGIT